MVMMVCLQKQQMVSLNSLRFKATKSAYDRSIHQKHYDLAIIGGGSGGISCALSAAKGGLSVIVFDYVPPSE